MIINPVIVGAVLFQGIISKVSKIGGAIAGFVLTTGILIWGLSAYAEGYLIAVFGIPLTQHVFIYSCLVWYVFDARALIKALNKNRLDSIHVEDGGRTLDEKRIEEIAHKLESETTPALRNILLSHDEEKYTAEAFEAIQRILSSREEKIINEIKANLNDGESIETAMQIKQKKEKWVQQKEELHERQARSETIEKTIASLRSNRKIISIIGIMFFFVIIFISFLAKDTGTFIFYMFVLLLLFVLPYALNRKKSQKLSAELLSIGNEIDRLSKELKTGDLMSKIEI